MIETFILGPPHTATTYQYFWWLKKLKAKGIFEPFNYEVVYAIFKLKYHAHYIMGEVPHNYYELPRNLQDLIFNNAKWHAEWIYKKTPSMPFLGQRYKEVLKELDEHPNKFVVKDVHAWIKLDEIYKQLPNTFFVLTLPKRERLLRSAMKFYKIIREPANRGHYMIFWRYLNNLSYPESCSEDLFRIIVSKIYDHWESIVKRYEFKDNVIVVRYEERVRFPE